MIYPPWNFLRYGSASVPLPAGGPLEAPLAERIAERVAQVRAHPNDAQAWGKLGETYDVHEIFPQAILCYERAQLLAPADPRWPYWLGIAQRVGDQKAALACFERTIGLSPDLAAAHFYAAHGYLALERPDDARREFERALALEPEAPAALIGMAKLALSRDDGKTALEFLARAGQQPQSTSEARWLSAAAWRALGDETKAQSFSAPNEAPPAQETFPDKLRSQLFWDEGVTLAFARQRSDAYLARGENDRALQELQLYVDKAPKSADALVLLADAYSRVGKPDEALARYQAACTLDPTQASALSQWGLALARKGRTAEALAKLRQALDLEPSSVEFKSNIAILLCSSQEKNDREEGLRLLGEAAEARPEDVSLRLNLAQALRANGRNEEALAAFLRVLALAPDDARMRFEYGVLCATTGHLEDAAQAFARVVELSPSKSAARINLARALTQLGRHQAALAALRSFQEFAPHNVEARSGLAWMLCTSPDDGSRAGPEALALAKELTSETEAKNPEMLVILSAAQAEVGDFESAVKSIEQALELLKPKPPDPVYDPAQVGIIDRALEMDKAFKAGKPYRSGGPQ